VRAHGDLFPDALKRSSGSPYATEICLRYVGTPNRGDSWAETGRHVPSPGAG